MTSDKKFGVLMITPLVVVLIAAVGYPVATSLNLSVTDFTLTSKNVQNIGMENYAAAFSDTPFWEALWTTTAYTVLAVSIELILGIAIAAALVKQKRWVNITRSVLISPMFIAPIAVGLMFRFLLNGQSGAISKTLAALGIDHDFFGSGNVLYTLVGMDVWQWTPFMVLLMLAGMLSMPTAPLEAARVDGAGALYRLRRVLLPMLRPTITVALVLRALDAMRVFEYVFATTKGGPGTESVTVQYFIYQRGIQFFDLGYASALAFIVLAIVAVIVLVFARRVVRQHG